MVTQVKLQARAQDGSAKTFDYKPGDKHPAGGKTIYKLIVDGQEKLPPGTKITRSGNNVLVEFPDGQTFEFTDWCGIGDSRLIDLEGAQALTVGDAASYVAAKEIESGACMIANENGQSAGALGQSGATSAPAAPVPSGGGFNPIYALAALPLLALGGGGGGGGGGGSNPTPTKPATPSGILSLPSDSGTAGDNTTSDTTPTITGTGGAPGQTIELRDESGTVLGSGVVAPDGTWSITPANPLPEGLNHLQLVAKDSAGNTSNPQPLDLSIDSVVPATPVAPDMTAASDTGSSSNDDLTRNSRPSFSVAPPAPGETPVLFVDGVEVPATFDQATNTLTPTGSLTPGVHEITTASRDVAGNISPPSLPLTITITPVAALDPSSDSNVPGDNITTDKTPSIQGFGTPGDRITVSFPGEPGFPDEVKIITITNPDGSWQVTPDNPLSDGVKAITVVATNPTTGVVTSSSTVTITIDSTPPNAPSIADIPENTSNNTISAAEAVDGTTIVVNIPSDAKAGDILTLNIGGQAVTYAVQAADIGGTATVPVSAAVLAALGDGTVPVSATLTDAAGNVSAPSPASSLTLDRTAPSAPSITSVPDNNNGGINAVEDDDGVLVNVALPTDAKAGDTLIVTLNGTPTEVTLTATDISNGSAPITLPLANLPAADGTYALTAQVRDVAGNLGSASAPFDITLDRNASGAPATAPDMTAATDSGSSNSDNTTGDTTPSFTVPAPAAGETPKLYVDGVLVPSTFDALTDTLTPVNPIADGPHTVSYTVTDAAGNESPRSPDLPVVIDTAAPTAPVAPDMTTATDSGSLNNDDKTNDSTPDFSVSVPAGFTATLYVDGVAVPATLVGGVLTPTTAIADGPHSITYTVTDVAGNESTQSSALPITIDTAAPSAPAALDMTAATDTGSSNTDNNTNNVTPSFTVPAPAAGETPSLYVDGVKVPATFNAGTNTLTPTTPLTAGTHSITSTVTDAAGNESAQSPALPINIDTGAPSAPVAPDMTAATDSGSSNSDDDTSNTTPSFTVPAPAAGETPKLYVDGVLVPSTFNTGTSTLTPTTPLTTGSHNITSTITDAAGNESAQSPALAIIIDTTAPSAPTAPDMTAATDSGTSNSDNNSNDTTPTFTVPAPATGETPKLYVEGVLVPSTFDSATNTLTPTTPLSDGPHSITSTVTDAAGNESAQSPALAITIDTTAPSAPSVTAVPENSNGGVNAAEASDGTVIQVSIPADAKAGDTLSLNVGGQTVTYTVLAGDVGSTANVTVGAPVLAALTDGTIPVTATLTDQAGNVGTPSAPFNFTLDRGTPAAPATLDLTPGSDTGTSSSDDNTSDTTPTITGAPVEAGATVTLYDSNGTIVLGTTVADASGNWSITSSALADGVHNFTTKQTDQAGNQGPASAVLAVTIDTTKPGAPAAPDMTAATDSGTSNSDNNSNDTTPTFTVPAPATGETPKLYVEGVLVPSTFDSATNTLTPTTPLSDGPHSITSTVTDAAGNESAQSPALAITIDTTAPSAPSVTAVPENSNGGVNAAEASDGTVIQVSIPADAKAGDTLSLNVGGQTVTYTVLAGDVGSTANVTVGAPVLAALTDGTIPVTATLTDQAGNVGTPQCAV